MYFDSNKISVIFGMAYHLISAAFKYHAMPKGKHCEFRCQNMLPGKLGWEVLRITYQQMHYLHTSAFVVCQLHIHDSLVSAFECATGYWLFDGWWFLGHWLFIGCIHRGVCLITLYSTSLSVAILQIFNMLMSIANMKMYSNCFNYCWLLTFFARRGTHCKAFTWLVVSPHLHRSRRKQWNGTNWGGLTQAWRTVFFSQRFFARSDCKHGWQTRNSYNKAKQPAFEAAAVSVLTNQGATWNWTRWRSLTGRANTNTCNRLGQSASLAKAGRSHTDRSH